MSAGRPFRLDGQAAIVTGASAGLGAIMARGLADAGCAVLVAARRAEPLARLAEDIAGAGGRAVATGPTCAIPATPRSWSVRRLRPSGGSTASS